MDIFFTLSLEVALLQINILEGCAALNTQHFKPASKSEKTQRAKISRDRQAVKDILRRTLIEVAEHGEWQTLQKATEHLNQRESSALNKKITQEKLKISLDRVLEELEIKRKLWQSKIQNADSKIPLLRDKINDDSLNVKVRLCYAEKWLLARSESLELQYCNETTPFPRRENEQRVHKELLKAYELQIKEHEECLEKWQRRYNVDITRMNERLVFKAEELRKTTNHRIELQNLFDLHKGEIRGWLTFKRERAARLAREERQRVSATRIQAWWRGVMVRRALGAFRHLCSSKKFTIKPKKK